MSIFVSDGFGVVAGEQACFSPQLAFPPGMIRAVQDLYDITGLEVQLICLLSMETVESSDLQHGGEGTYRQTDTQTQSMNQVSLYCTGALSFNFPFLVH